MKTSAVFLSIVLVSLSGRAATRSFTNSLGGSWHVAANWSPNGVPIAGDTANITSAGTYNVLVTNAVTVANLTLGNASGTQTLLVDNAVQFLASINGVVQPNGILLVTNGGLEGKFTVQSGGQLKFDGSSSKNVYDLTLVNQGTVIWSGSGLLNAGSTPTTVISNGGLWQITGDSTLYQPFGGPTPVFDNFGTVRKSAGTGTSQISAFNIINEASGLFDALSGTLAFGGTTSNLLGGSLTATTPGIVSINAGTWYDFGGSASGSGVNQFSSGTLNLRTNIIPGLRLTGGDVYVIGTNTFQQAGAITNLTLDGSQLRGTNRIGNGTVTINSGGAQEQLTVLPLGQLVLATAGTKNVYALTLLNQGTVTWSSGQLNAGSTPTTVISNGGLWQITGDAIMYQPFGGPTPVFDNFGTVRKSAGSGNSQILGFNIMNEASGLFDALSGTLTLGGATSNLLGGLLTSTSPGIISLTAGTWFDLGGSASGSGVNQFAGGTLNLRTNIIPGLRLTGGDVYVIGTNTFQQAGAITNLTLDGSQLRGTNRIGNGTVTINSGGAQEQLTVLPLGQLVLATAGTKNVYALTLLNQGTVTWSSGQLNAGSTPTTVISNGGLWQITGDSTLYQPFGGPTPVFDNFGTVRKSAGSGNSQILGFNIMNEASGLFDALSGTLTLGGATSNLLGGLLTSTSPGIISLTAGTWFDLGGSASGSGVNQFAGGTLNLRTNIIPGLRLTGGDVYVIGTNTFQQAGAITNLTLDGSQLRGTNRIGNGTVTINSGGAQEQLTVLPLGQLVLATAGTKNVYALTLLNQGTVTWSSGQLNAGSTPTTVISNGGLWQITGDSTLYQPFGGPTPVFDNFGTVRKSAGSGTSQISAFNIINEASGLFDALSGTLTLGGATSNLLGGLLTSTSPGIISLTAGTWFDLGGSASGSGVNQFAGGTLNLRTNIIPGLRLTGGDVYVIGTNTFQQAGAITNLTLDGSQLRGTNRIGNGTVTINSGGAQEQLTVLPLGQLVLATAGTKNVYALTLLNQGTVTWSGSGLLNAGSTPTTVISNGGLWQITGDSTLYQPFGGPTPVWTNAGTLRKTAGSGISQIIGFDLVNLPAAIIQSDSGTLSLPSTYTNTAGTLRLNGGTLQSGGTLGMTAGTLDGSGTLGANSFTGGLISPGQGSSAVINFNSGLNLAAGATVSLSGTGTIPGSQYDQLSVVGTVTLSNATLQIPSLPSVSAGTTFVLIQNDGVDPVLGTFNGLAENAPLTVSGQPFRIHYGGGTGNDVTLVRDAGAAAPQLSSGSYSNGMFRLVGGGGGQFVYTIQATTNFLQWTNIGTVTGDVSGNFSFTDPNTSAYRYRFYRTTN